MSERTNYWHIVWTVLKTASDDAPTDADKSLTLSMAYRALALSQTSDGGPTYTITDANRALKTPDAPYGGTRS